MILVHKLTGRVLRRAHQMFGLVIAVALGTIALTAAATMAGLACEEIQTAELIRDWHKHSTELRTQQNQINSEIVNEIADLRQAVKSLEGQLEIWRKRIQLKCDWNVTS